MAATPRELETGALDAPRPCGECSLCCKFYPVDDLQKPRNTMCRHFAKGAGCSIHADRPQSCRDFQCIWTFAAPLDERWRPDRCKFVMRAGITGEMMIDVDPSSPGAWKREPFYGQVKGWSDRSNPDYRMIIVRDNGRAAVVFPEGEVDLGLEQEYTPIQSGYVLRNGRQQPYAHYGTDPDPPPAEA